MYFNKSFEALFSALNHFCAYFERCSNFKFEAIKFFYVIVFKCKWVSGFDTYEVEKIADSIIWELFSRKSAESLNLHNSFITISSLSLRSGFIAKKLLIWMLESLLKVKTKLTLGDSPTSGRRNSIT